VKKEERMFNTMEFPLGWALLDCATTAMAFASAINYVKKQRAIAEQERDIAAKKFLQRQEENEMLEERRNAQASKIWSCSTCGVCSKFPEDWPTLIKRGWIRIRQSQDSIFPYRFFCSQECRESDAWLRGKDLAEQHTAENVCTHCNRASSSPVGMMCGELILTSEGVHHYCKGSIVKKILFLLRRKISLT
jgi:hypothetical protein